MSKIIIRESRQFSALSLIIGAVVLAFFAFADRSRSANPTAGMISPSGPTSNWVGPALGGASLDESTYTPTNCDSYTITLAGTPADWAGKKAHIKISWANANDDSDVFVQRDG